MFLLSRTGSGGRLRVEMVWFNLKIGSFDTFHGTGCVWGWVVVIVGCWVVCCCVGLVGLNTDVGWLFCWFGRFVFEGGVWKGLLWGCCVVLVVAGLGCCWDCCGTFPLTGGILIPKLPSIPPRPWLRSFTFPKVIVVACGCPNPKPPNKLAKGLNGCCVGGVVVGWDWGCCVDDGCCCCWVVEELVVVVGYGWLVVIFAIKWTVLPDYLTKKINKNHTVICHFIIIN